MSTKISCIIVDDEPTAREIISSHLSKIDRIEVIATCSNALEAFNCINTQKVDLIFLDINMPEISGISFAKSINKDIKIIFTTAYREYAIDGFDLHAVDYLLKPIAYERLLNAIHNYFEVYHKTESSKTIETSSNEFIFVRSDRRMKKVDFAEIIYIESYSDYVKIHCSSNTIVTRETISTIESKLPQQYFMRTHRSYIIAISRIDSFSNEEIIVGKKSIPISRNYKAEVLSRLENM
ncbi:DNA-binding LytR/AlgR family response regulator [Aquimarina sp. EL_43]|uniref:LytR/AlgR family response regulator transcription factor n=1 Tax=unclassified Aquimarina TaxID=2627091 RepID=UPI0018CAFC29|nr:MULTISPECIES: LytTR family DNA-binding domain-containing protein [unclassified Aquimarina]MBG6132139.1 DNA-binding LytR/AlgR family response regulator [Aquimarina sp. EL_35]MBG6152936.1 DNA-binding LytR/AlgR family response regulator [Aquimarina sp. EL_32]MBG6170943.1 DNA-binding LytR/AlgR family response regulator [Aquimarina sp. EL_43]